MLQRHEQPPLLDTNLVQTSGLAEAIKIRLENQTEEFSLSLVVADWLKLDPKKVGTNTLMEISLELRKQGCARIRTRNGSLYLPPEKPGVLNPLDPLPLDKISGDIFKGLFWAIAGTFLAVVVAAGILIGLYSWYQLYKVGQPIVTLQDWSQQ